MGEQLSRLLGRALLCALLTSLGFYSHAGQERYDYDPLGRLLRVIDEQGRVTEYVYDAAGNIKDVVVGGPGTAQPPSIASITPADIRRGESKQIQITGANLTGATVAMGDPELDISDLTRTATQITFRLTASLAAALGAHPLTLRSAAGIATGSITVNPVLPQVFVDPAPLAIPPDKVARPFTIRLSHADNVDHTIALSASNEKIIVAPASVTISAGQTAVQANITGASAGQSTLRLTSTTLETTLVPVYITGEFSGINTSFSRIVGVVMPGGSPPSTTITPVASRTVGVLVGAAVQSVSPKAFNVGSGPITLTVGGVGLETAQTIAVVPPTGVTLGAMAVAPDGHSITVPITVAADAPVSPRRVVVTGAGGVRFPAVPFDADRIYIVRPPEITSIAPIYGVRGTTVALTVRGRNLFDAQAVSMTPSVGITTGTMPDLSADGTKLDVGVAMAANAPLGPRTVVVTTIGGSSDATPAPANTFSVVSEAVQTVDPIVAPAVGVMVEGIPQPQTLQAYSGLVGVTVGSVVTAMTPNTGTIGQTVTLTLAGQGLQGVTAVQFTPGTGLTAGAPTVAPDGTAVNVSVTIAADAPQTLRTARALAGTATIPFASPAANQFRVTAPQPELDAVTPIVLQVGQAPLELTIRGRNFQNASQVRVVPADGMTVSVPPVVKGAGTEVSVNMSAAANAATGARALVVVTPSGESSSTLTPQNTLTLVTTPGPNVTPVVSTALGVVRESDAPPPTIVLGPVVSSALGVVVESDIPPPTVPIEVTARRVGVAVGPVATGVAPTAFAPNTNGALATSGVALNGVTSVTVNPSTGVTLGAPTIAPEGTQITVPITIASDAPAGPREVRLSTASGRIAFADPAASRFAIGVGVPQLDSITPIIGQRGQTFQMLIRGARLAGAIAVTATPAAGIVFSNTPTPNAAGTELTIDMSIAPDAPLGARVIQVHVPGASSNATPTPANTFEVTQ